MMLCCLHGNLQTPAVWQFLVSGFAGSRRAPDLLAIPAATQTGYHSWVRAFCQVPHDRREILLGYSLGGRLALHAVLAAPNSWAGAMVIAAHPGLPDPAARAKRRDRDRQWARRFAREPLAEVLADWDRQAVFGGIPYPLPRQLDATSRVRFVTSCQRFSLGYQADLREALYRAIDLPPILYITGARDDKYCQIGRELAALCPAISHRVVAAAAHRVPWENPQALSAIAREFGASVG